MKLILVDPKSGCCAAFHKHFADLPDVEIINGYFQEVPEFDCMVSPANSFGLMDGGVDAAIIRVFGSQLMNRVQRRILEEYRGEQPVGTSIIVETEHPKHPFLAHSPTMRIPMTIAHTDNVYRAMWATLLAVFHHNKQSERKIEILVCPGLGTGTGGVPYSQAARQMALAYRNFLNPPPRIDWFFAGQRQEQVRYGGDDGFHYPPEID